MRSERHRVGIGRFAVVIVAVIVGGAALAHAGEPLQVFILAGQSNMQGHAHVRTIDALRLAPAQPELYELLCTPDGTPRVAERVWISSIGSSDHERTGLLTAGFGASAGGPTIGPELSFGLTMERPVDAPILIIKTAWGGRSLHADFRPPSAGPVMRHEPSPTMSLDAPRAAVADRAGTGSRTGPAYREMIAHVQQVLADPARVCPAYDAADGVELAGFVWFQGWNDLVARDVYPDREGPGGYDAYTELLALLIEDVRRDLDAPALPVVIGVMGVGGALDSFPPEHARSRPIHDHFRRAMAATAARPAFAGSVVAVPTAPDWDQGVASLLRREKREIADQAEVIRRAVRDGERTRAAGDAAIEALYAEHFTPDELALLRASVSDAEYHYLGSARIIAPIGRVFAEALVALRRGDPPAGASNSE